MKDLATLFSRAFRQDPLMAYLFSKQDECSRYRFFAFIFDHARVSKQLILTEGNENLSVAACIETPESQVASKSMMTLLHRITLVMSFAFKMRLKSFMRINAYMKHTSKFRPKAPHHYLVCIAVDPSQQGQGLGKSMLNNIHDMVDKHPRSTGIALDTENFNNVKIYERFGYELSGQESLGNITVYTMFRKNPSVTL